MRIMYPFELDSFRIAFAPRQCDGDAEPAAYKLELELLTIHPPARRSLIGKITSRTTWRLRRTAARIGVLGLLLVGTGLGMCGCIERAKPRAPVSMMT